MCMTPKVDNSVAEQQKKEAAQARKREKERQGRIKAGSKTLDRQFSKFDDKFYADREKAYLDFYEPQLNDQFGKAKQDMTYALARAGTLNSTIAADKTGDLDKQFDTNKALIVSQGKQDLDGFKTNIANEKSALLSQLNATADATRVSNDALGRTQMMFNSQPAYSPLGDIFLGAAQGIGGYMQNRQNQAYLQAAGVNPRRSSGKTI
jgi:hypothetical protein